MSFSIDLEVADPRWRKVRGLVARLREAADLALKRGGAPRGAALTILLTGDAQLRSLNHDFRGRNKPTNVLSFPAPKNAGRYLGDVALAYGVAEKEARAAARPFAHHATHLVVHGVLHLLGFDHVTPGKAREMEPLETRILARLGIADPYEEAA
ncbi:MAG TPA: rRNA maturation RNase YbeY [Rhizomicrobium sp.]|nr:rRNA maturation RNase YbeY [Rhizomicrobium sp.]